jgi:hypothetical protein
MTKKYYDNKMLMQNLQDELQAIKEKEDNLYKISINDENYEDFKNECNKMTKYKNINITSKEIILNNFLHIQQNLLKELLEIFKNKYIKSRIGEKTKEKIQNDFNNYILDNYNIECYSHINQKINYKNEFETKISLYFKDFYYQYELKQEEIRYNHFDNESYLYYYNETEYTPTEEIKEKAELLYNNYTENMERIRELKKEIENIREENNKDNKCCIKSTYIDYREI